MPGGPKPIDPKIRFFRYVRKTKYCWYWTGAIGAQGYGAFTIRAGQRVTAHRYSFQIHRGTPSGFVCHKCDIRSCVNPNHLFLSDHRGNMLDMANKGRAPNLKIPIKRRVEIISRKNKGESFSSIASDFKVTKEAISYWYRRLNKMNSDKTRPHRHGGKLA